MEVFAAGVIQLPKTGQTISSAIGDDGDLQIGVAWPNPRFTDNGNGTLTDALTGLSWVKPGNLMVTRNPTFDTDGTAGDGLVTWQHALNYVKKLNTESYLGYNDWRLPNVDELVSLYDYSKTNPATSDIFTNLGADYWSSTNNANDLSQAWTVNLQSPSSSVNWKTLQYAVLPVRGGTLASGTGPDTTAPTIQAFGLPQNWDSLTVPVEIFNVVDLQGVTGYYLSESATPPAAATGWKSWVAYPYYPYQLISYAFGSPGAHTLYAWVKDAAGNVSASAMSTVTITLPTSTGTSTSVGAKVPATGQTISTIAGDDGDLQKGVAWPVPRFSQNGLWTVTDALTGLIWVQPGNLMVLRDPAYDADGTAGDGLVTWQHALNYVKKLNTENYLGYTDWRLPNVDELVSLYDYSKTNPATSDIYTNLGTDYWSSTNNANDLSQAWTVNLQSPSSSVIWKTSQYAVLPVRGGTIASGTGPDTTAPTIQAFGLPQTWDSLTVPVEIFNVVDLQGVTGYYLSESVTTPAAGAAEWKAWVPYPYYPNQLISYAFGGPGAHTLYAWVKDAAGNVSASAVSTVTITLLTSTGTSTSVGAKVPATGQTVSTTDGDDGALQKGVAWPVPRFSQNGLWMVTDALTGLIWVQPGNLMVLRDPAYDADGTAGDGLVTWQHALDYVKKLNIENYLGYNDWRLPNVDELISLYDFSKTNPATSDSFTNLGTDYWSSTNDANDLSQAWAVNLQSPSSSVNGKSSLFAVLPLRGGAVQTVASLLVVKQGSGTGTVSSSPNGISCGSACGMMFDHTGDVYTLSANADTGSAFTGWGGPCNGTGTCTATMSGDVAVTANFNQLRTVTVAKSGPGDGTLVTAPSGISCGATCSAKFPDTATVTITAQLPITSVVASWTGCDSSTDTQCTITIAGGDRQVGVFLASKNATTLTLSLSSSAILNNGSVIASGKLTRLPDNGSDLSGQTVTLTVTPPAGTSQQPFTATTTTDAAGHYTSNPIAGFTQKGAYTIQATTAATATIIAASSPVATLMVGAQAGYAIIVQGKYPTNEGLAEHAKTANRVYKAMIARGLNDDNINFLSYQSATDAAAAGVVVDGVPSRSAVQTAITSWAKEKLTGVQAPLWIVMVDHGASGNFYVGNEMVTPADLNTWITNLENAATVTEKRIVIDGSCYSGTFIPTLSKAGRVVITSATATEESYRGPLEPDNIRSGEYFLDALFAELKRGSALKNAFDVASQLTRTLTRAGGSNGGNGAFNDGASQHPLLDDDGSGHGVTITSDSGEGSTCAALYLGTGQTITNAGEPADIQTVTGTAFLGEGVSDPPLWLTTYGSSSSVDTAWVEIRSPSVTLAGAGGIATMQLTVDLPKLPMTFDSASNRWKAVRSPYAGTTFTGFIAPGTYEFFYYTRDLNGVIHTKRGVLYRQTDTNSVPNPFNLLSPADASAQKTTLALTWDTATDPDGDPLTYTVQVSKDSAFASVDYRLEGLTDPVAALGPEAGLTDLTTYYWRVRAIDQYGGIRYSSQTWSFRTDNTNGLPAVVTGYVRDGASGAPVANATISIGVSTVRTLANGAFVAVVPPGSLTIAIEASGYARKTASAIGTAGAVTAVTLYLSSGSAPEYAVTTNSPSGGSISCVPASAAAGAKVTCTITSSAGYRLSGLSDNAANVFSGVVNNMYTIANISADHALIASFSATSRKSGDCNGDGTVTIAEVQSAILMYLGLTPVASCVDQDGNGMVSISEVQKVINAFLGL